MSKKFLIITISLVLGLVLIGLVGYYFTIQSNEETPTEKIVGVFKNFFPFGENPVSTEQPLGGEPTATSTETTQPDQIKKLRKISSEPVAGAGVLDIKMESSTQTGTIVRHIEKATGHIFGTELFSPKQIRISNTTIPMVYDAIWGNKNDSLVARYLKDDNRSINTYGLILKQISTSTESAVSAIKFPENISDISVFGNSVFSLEQKTLSSTGYVSNFDGSRRFQIWDSPIKELLSQYVNAKTVALTTKPDKDTKGFLFFVDTGNGQSKKILGDVLGLSTLVDNTATQVLFLDQSDSAELFLFDIKEKSSASITPTTFPEKCVWSKKDKNIIYCAVPGEYIDRNSLASWYLGFISFTDGIWKYDIKNNTSNIIMDLFNDGGERIDVIKPLLSENEQYLVFINKIDGSLWSLDLIK